MRDLVDARRRHRPSTQHVAEKRTDVVASLWTAERDEQNGIEGRHAWGGPRSTSASAVSLLFMKTRSILLIQVEREAPGSLTDRLSRHRHAKPVTSSVKRSLTLLQCRLSRPGCDRERHGCRLNGGSAANAAPTAVPTMVLSCALMLDKIMFLRNSPISASRPPPSSSSMVVV